MWLVLKEPHCAIYLAEVGSPLTVLGYFLMIDGCTVVNVLVLLLTTRHIFLFLCFCPQLSECSSQQIQGLSSLRPNLVTLSICHSTETMMVLSDSFDAFHCEFPISCIEKCVVF